DKSPRRRQWSDKYLEKVISIAGTHFTDEETCDIPRDAGLWDEFNPNLQMIDVVLTPLNHSVEVDGIKTTYAALESATFGLRDISSEGTQFTINGRKAFIRGTLDCASYPLTGHPPTDVESWKRVIRTAKAHGLNEIRFHSWCPPEAAFAAADELGFYFHVE